MTTVPFGQHVCWCGKPYAPTSDGRWTHRTIFAHTPSDGAIEAPPKRDGNARTCDNQGAKKTARDGEGNTDPGLTNRLHSGKEH